MKKLTKLTIAAILIIAVCYIAFAFILAQWNPMCWFMELRALFVVACCVLVVYWLHDDK